MDHQHHQMTEGEHSPLEYLKLALVLAVISANTHVIYTAVNEPTLTVWLRIFMGVFFIVFAGFKLAGYRMFVEMFAGYDVIAKRNGWYAKLYPFIELGLGLLYIANVGGQARDWLALIIMGVGSLGVFSEIQKRSSVHCACLGNIIKLPLSTVSLVEDVGMGLMAAAMLLLG